MSKRRQKRAVQKRGKGRYRGVIDYHDGDVNQILEGPELQIVLRFPEGESPSDKSFTSIMAHSPKGNMLFIVGIRCKADAPESDTDDVIFHIGFS